MKKVIPSDGAIYYEFESHEEDLKREFRRLINGMQGADALVECLDASDPTSEEVMMAICIAKGKFRYDISKAWQSTGLTDIDDHKYYFDIEKGVIRLEADSAIQEGES
jgi:hypothetical protein